VKPISFQLEPAVPEDEAELEALLDQCFALGRRTKTSYRLREGNKAVDGLSMVIRDAELGLVGAISYWPLIIGKSLRPAILLGPLAVHPARQNLGIGRALMSHTLQLAKDLGHELVLLVGDAPYYARVGFKLLPHGLLQLPGPFDEARFLYLELKEGALQGAEGLVLPAFRKAEFSAAFSIPQK
jgi:predicted N-acetyltransferase YhbS